jgi:hypothetical protein
VNAVLIARGGSRAKSLNAPSMIVRFIRSGQVKAIRAPTNETRLSDAIASGAWQGNALKFGGAFQCTVLCITSAAGGLVKSSPRLKKSTGKQFLRLSPLDKAKGLNRKRVSEAETSTLEVVQWFGDARGLPDVGQNELRNRKKQHSCNPPMRARDTNLLINFD